MARESVGKRIKRLRLANELSQRELAVPKKRVTYAYISRIEAGARNPSFRALRVLAEKLGVTAFYLEKGEVLEHCPHCGHLVDTRPMGEKLSDPASNVVSIR